MLTAFVDPTHMLPCTYEAPTLRNPLGGGADELKSQFTRVMKSWELEVPALQERVEPFIGFLEFMKGDTPFFFDMANFGDLADPIPIKRGNGVDTQIRLPHRHVFVSTIVLYIDDELYTDWTPLGDGIICEGIELADPVPLNSVAKAKYKRKAKCVVDTTNWTNTRVFRNANTPWESLFNLKVRIREIAQ